MGRRVQGERTWPRAHARRAQGRAVACVEHAHAGIVVVGDEDPALLLIHRDGPRIVAQTPSASVQGSIDSVRVTFGESIDTSTFSVADLLLGAVLSVGKRFELTGGMPAVEAYVDRLEARPARERANSIPTAA